MKIPYLLHGIVFFFVYMSFYSKKFANVKLGRVSHLWVWKITPKDPKLFIFFPSGKKNLIGSGQMRPWTKTGQSLIYCRSKVCLKMPAWYKIKILLTIYLYLHFYLRLLVMGPGQKFLTLVGSGCVSHLWFGFEFQKFPLKT